MSVDSLPESTTDLTSSTATKPTTRPAAALAAATLAAALFIGMDATVKTLAHRFDALQLTFNVPLATPANWTVGQDVIVALALNDDQAREKYGSIDIKLPYLRTTQAPK